MYIDGLGYTSMLRYLNENGFVSSRGRPFSKASLHDILANEKYTGVFIYNRATREDSRGKRNNHASKDDNQIIRIEGGVPAVVDRLTWERAKRRHLDNRRRAASYTSRATYLLSGVVYCSKCGHRATGATRGRDRNGTVQRYYVCQCQGVSYKRKERLENAVLSFLQAVASNATVHAQIERVANMISVQRTDTDRRLIESYEAKIADYSKRIEGIIDFIASSGKAAPATLAETLETLERQREEARDELRDLRTDSSAFVSQQLIAAMDKFAHIKNDTHEQQKAVIQSIVSRVELYDDRFVVVPYNCTNGGGEENRTPVRKPFKEVFSERSLRFGIPPAARP